MSNPEKKEKKNKYYYAVKYGFKPGIYTKWEECKEQVNGFPKPVYKKFDTEEDAKIFINPECAYLVSETTKTELIDGVEFSEYDLDKYISSPETWNKYDNKLYIFTDGSDVGNGNTRIGIYFGKRAINISQDISNSTNNRCELTAIKYAMEIMIKFRKEIRGSLINDVIIVSDSEYCVKALTDWMYKWKNNKWQTSTGKPVLNVDIIKEISFLKVKMLVHKINFNLEHMNSHKAPPLNDKYKLFLWKGNQIADYLAKGIK